MSRRRLYPIDLFGLEKLASTDALERALQELQGIFTKDNFKHVSQELFNNESPDTPLLVLSYHTADFIISGVPRSFKPRYDSPLSSFLRLLSTTKTYARIPISRSSSDHHSVNIKTQHRNKKDNLRRNLCGNHEGAARLWLHPVDGPMPSLAFNYGFLHSA
ncbi:hypothetical protein ARMGADRAFT_1100110 [Armillaria gallica]|uniref:Uncharacterized protein n=1 Tax=Armillaria gallica TaxID=47427 RepID=A0A2H3C9L1_ARMGA|nr:hypothetical protein ARMGADRAFT_1100110 [Armillaria gallica]